MAVHSGRFGLVGGVSTVRNWQITDAGTLSPAVASNTAFGTGRRQGIEDWNGNYGIFGYQPPTGQMPGDLISFVGYTAPDNDQGGAGITYLGQAMIKQLAISWNWNAGEMMNMTVDFEGHLALAAAVQAPPLDLTLPVLVPVVTTKVQIAPDNGAGAHTYTDLLDMMSATWTLTNSVQPYVNSGTFLAGSPGRLWTGKKSGIIDWVFSWTENNTDRTRVKKGDSIAMRLFVTPTLFWELKWGMVQDFTNIVIDRESGKIISQTVNVHMNGVSVINGALGAIVKPDTSIWWPIAQT